MIVEKEELRQQTSIREIVASYTPIKGKTALCPFHPDKNPSLSFSESKGLWHCFACGVGGDVFTFVMMAEDVPFGEAFKILCDRQGINHTYNSPQEKSEAIAIHRKRKEMSMTNERTEG